MIILPFLQFVYPLKRNFLQTILHKYGEKHNICQEIWQSYQNMQDVESRFVEMEEKVNKSCII